ncbi:TIGR02099 family protein [Gilvimarinus agarilyticus]|uniref:YhdP family protein n=1 Tax=Gilvimarinus sp. 2_MG-2023 TaxID=3062666 RepID=UPI001C0A4DE7|nr:YhdP family protein [Gilvimarinus sp. 2_MG-2023]MBU2885435.1 TIGR02099 family protein [Gilvimarinus agarilyticus]MDO6570335.1 YhdP family protein [Gilvimarinus sp. 2_MG-2023]
MRKFYLLLAILVIVLAVVVQLGRNFSYLISDYRDEIATALSVQAKAQVTLSSLEAQWDGLQPSVIAQGIRLEDDDGTLLGEIARAQLRLDLIASLLNFQPVWSNVAFSGGSLTVNQSEAGHWMLSEKAVSEEASKTSSGDNQKLMDMLLAARRINFDHTQLHFKFQNGDTITLQSPRVLVENRNDFHRLLISVDVEQNKNALFIVMESSGDPRQPDSTVASYIQFRDFPLSTPADVLTAQFVNKHLGRGDLQGTLNAGIWLNKTESNSAFEVVGELSLSNTVIPVANGELDLQAVNADLSGYVSDLNHWQLGVSSLEVTAQGKAQTDLALLAIKSGARSPTTLRINELNPQWLTQVLLGGNFFEPDGQLENLALSLDPHGRLHNLQFVMPAGQPALWQLTAFSDNIDVGSWNGAPGATGVSGYITANARQGVVHLDARDNFSVLFEGVYEQPMQFNRAQGQVSWLLRPEQNVIDVYSSEITASDGTEQLQGQFHLHLPYQRNSGPIELTISATAQQVAAQQYKKYIPIVLPESLREYIEQGVGKTNAGIAKQAQFIYRGVLNDGAPEAHNVALSLNIDQASFHYQDNWPEVHDTQGSLLVDNDDVYVRIASGRIYNSEVIDAEVILNDNPAGEGALLTIVGHVDGIASDGLRILRQSVLREYVGDQMDSWYLHGEIQAAIDIAIPLQEQAAGGHYAVDVNVQASSFDLDNLALELDDVKGRIRYDDKAGIQTQDLTAQLFGHPLQVAMRSATNESGLLTIIEAQGSASADQLAHWSEQPGLLFADGTMPLRLSVELNHGDETAESREDQRLAAISVHADLTEAAVNLPTPLGKERGEPGTAVVNYIMGSETTFVDVHYLDQVRAMLHFEQDEKALISGAVGLAAEPEFPSTPGLHISGRVEQIDIATWQNVLSQYRGYEQRMLGELNEPQVASSQIPISTDLLIHRQPLGAIALTDLRLRARQLESGWDFLINNNAINGELYWPILASEPMRIVINSLNVPAELLEGEGGDKSLELTNTHTWPDAEVSIDSLRLADKDYGQWSFNLQPSKDKLAFTDIKGEIRGMEVKGINGAGATLDWTLGEAPQTALAAELKVANMSKTLQAWGAPPSLESQDALYRMDFTWPALPTDVDLETVSGQLDVKLGQGRYLRDSAGASDGLLKFLGLFNFDSLARRARLDFSDLYKSGLAFDSITGQVAFDEGQLNITKAFQLQSPSSRMELTGSVDMVAQTLDTRLVATLPMTGNLTVIAALAAGLPAAAGVFVISKLFEEQMNKVTSVRYAITGDWDDPQTEFLGVADSAAND